MEVKPGPLGPMLFLLILMILITGVIVFSLYL